MRLKDIRIRLNTDGDILFNLYFKIPYDMSSTPSGMWPHHWLRN